MQHSLFPACREREAPLLVRPKKDILYTLFISKLPPSKKWEMQHRRNPFSAIAPLILCRIHPTHPPTATDPFVETGRCAKFQQRNGAAVSLSCVYSPLLISLLSPSLLSLSLPSPLLPRKLVTT